MSVVQFPARPRWPRPVPSALARAAQIEAAGEAMAHVLEASTLTLDERIDALAALLMLEACAAGWRPTTLATALVHSAAIDGRGPW